MRHIDDDERRARLGLRHALAAPVSDPADAARAVAVLHSSDPVTVYLSVWARTSGFEVSDLEKTLYDDRSLIRFYGMRRTLWVIPSELVGAVHASSTRALGVRERNRTARLLEDGGITDDGMAFLQQVMPDVLDHIVARGEVLTRDLTRDLPMLQGKLVFHNRAGKVMGTSGVASRIVLQLSIESRVVRTRPVGSWVSGQYRWAETGWWLRAPLPESTVEESSRTLLAVWLRVFGPATEGDIRWWTGWPVRQVRTTLAGVEAVEVSLDGGEIGYVLPDDVEPVQAPPPWVALLPSLDPTTMGWKLREWYLGPHAGVLFDRNGNAGPTIWSDGRVVGGWAQRKDGVIVAELLDDVPSDVRNGVDARLAGLQEWIGDQAFTPRFRSPHDRTLAS